MKIVTLIAFLGLVLLHKTGAEIQCVQGSDFTATATNCVNTVTHCSQPVFTDYQGFADGVEYACGPCADGTKDVTCKECAVTQEGACNKPVQMGAPYSCFCFEFDTNTAKFKQKADKTTCMIASGSAVKCNKPTSTSAKSTYKNQNGCGPCEGSTKASKVCDDCDSADCNSLPTPIKCIQGSNRKAAATDCTDSAVTKCSKPKFTDYTGFSAVNYACGACASGTKDNTCEECDGSTVSGCNTPFEQFSTYNCYSFQFDEAKKQFQQLPDQANCMTKKGSAEKCNNPTSTSAKDTYTNKNGCGPCDGTTKDNGLCEECGSPLCNPLLPKKVGHLHTFKCYTYTYDAIKNNYTQKDTTCKRSKNPGIKRSKDAGIKCNMPATKDNAALYTNTDGCGGCAGSTKTDGACKECTDKALCNVLEPSSAERTTDTLLLPLAALLYCFI